MLLLVLIQWHTTQADDHCNDKKRGFILDSCADLSKIRRQPQSPSSYERNKRENNEVIYEDDEPNFNLQTLPHNGESTNLYISLHSKCFGFAAAIDTHIARCPRSFDEWSTSSMMVAHAIRRRLPCVVRNKLLLAHAARFPKLRSLFDQMPRSSGPPPRRQTHVSY